MTMSGATGAMTTLSNAARVVQMRAPVTPGTRA